MHQSHVVKGTRPYYSSVAAEAAAAAAYFLIKLSQYYKSLFEFEGQHLRFRFCMSANIWHVSARATYYWSSAAYHDEIATAVVGYNSQAVSAHCLCH